MKNKPQLILYDMSSTINSIHLVSGSLLLLKIHMWLLIYAFGMNDGEKEATISM